jgi:S1-C subfamily serine protease
VNALDAVIIGIAALAALTGWRTGFLARLAGWAGVAIALVAAVPLVAPVVTQFGGDSRDTRFVAAALFLLLAAMLGHGIAVGLAALAGHGSRTIRTADRVAGAAIGVLGALVLVWMLVPSLAALPGWAARETRSSAIVGAIDDLAPSQPQAFSVWGRKVSLAPFPSALDPLAAPPDPGPPPTKALPAAIDARVRQSVVLVRGIACDRLQSGTGWVGAPDVVVTNAHVVAGEGRTAVTTTDGVKHDATVVAFDPRRDVAVLSVPGLDRPVLPTGSPAVGTVGAFYGHPGGGPLKIAPARVGDRFVADGTNIYRTGRSKRDVLVVAALLAPGDSGGPLIDQQGRVVGTAFAVDPGNVGTAYALAPGETRTVLDQALRGTGAAVATGGCVLD